MEDRMRKMLALAALMAAPLAVVPAAFAQNQGAKEGAAKPDAALTAAIAGEWRTAANKARDPQRKPAEALAFWGLKPGMTILEVQPGGASYWTEILAPYARATGGKFYATGADLANPKISDGAKKSRTEFEQRYSDAGTYGKVNVVNWGPQSGPLPAGTFDFVLTSRSVHGWMRTPGWTEKVFADLHAALKPGGVLAVEQHRANPGPQDPEAKSGYVTEQFVIEQAEKAGFKLAGKSEINANAKDTKDHPFGVWTLPPTRINKAYGSNEPADPNFDHSKYDAIGESDRMTLRFVKAK
jgi:predicted methyltransferase